MKLLLDTNSILLLLRDEAVKNRIEQQYKLFDSANVSMISVVSIGEIKSLAIRNKWGEKRLSAVEKMFERFIVVNIVYRPLIDMYAEIDNFSQGTLSDKPLGMSARNMGKNDLWIAATAAMSEATLLTTDNDFDHLDDHYFKVEKLRI
jgi:tRNA(fMet)-specific endonuclease VapC